MRRTFILMFLMMFCSFGFGQNHWNQGVDGNSFPDHLNVIATVHIDEELQGGQNSNLELAAFCGDELRGVATLVYEEGLGKSLAYLMLYGKEGDQITFRVYDGTSKKEYIDLNVLDYKEDYDYGYGLKGKLGQIDSPYEVSFSAVASVPAQGYEVIYETLPTAVEAANAEQTVTLLKSVQGAGLVINKNITVDFGGFTYTINQAVGSTGTESQGFQLLKNNTVTLKDGNIAIAENTNVKWMFNAYANVTLAGLNVNCANMAVPAANEKNYVLVVNNGGGATPTVTYDGVNYSNFPGSNAPLYVDPSTKLVAEAGLNVETDKGYVVEYADNAYTAVAAVAKIGDVYYRTLPLAVEAATAGQTVELIADATGAGLKINKDITVDFGGFTYTINQAVGSTGTESQGFQLLKNNTVTLKDGNIAIAENTNVKWMFNAYANVTLAGLNVNCDNMATPAANEANYVLVVNNGGGATPTVNYSGVNVTNFPSTEQIWLDPTTTFEAVAGLEDLIETGAGYVVVYKDGAYTAVKANVQVKDGETVKGTYATIAEAVTEAQAGNTIVLLNDMNENATITKNLTIDGAGKNYTGTMTANNGLTVTVQNIDFVGGGFDKSNKSSTGHYTIKNCTFEDDGDYAYPVRFKGASSVTIEDCTVKNYLYSFLYITSGTNSVSVKNVTVEDCPNYAVYFASGVNSAIIENLTVKNSDNGFVINNTANRALTLKNCKLENVGTAVAEASGTNTITCTLLGNENDFGASALSEYAKIVLAETEATLSAPERLNVTTSVEGKAVVYENGVYKVAPAVAAITANEVTRYYATLQAAVNAAQANETVTLLSDATGAGVVIDKNVTIDFGGNIYTVNQAVGSAGTETLGFQILKNNDVTLKNGTLTSTTPVVAGKEVKMLIQNYADLTLTDMNLVDNTAHILYALSNNSGNVNLDGNTNITTDKVAFDVCKYASYTEPIVNVNTTGVIAGDIEVTTTQQTNLNISGGKFTKELQLAWCAEGYVPVKDGEYWTVVEGAIEVTYEDGSVAYFSRMIDAVPYNNNTALKNATIKLLNNCEGEGMRFWQNGMTFDLNGFKYTITEGTGSPTTKSQGFQIRPEVTGTVTIKGGTIDIKQGANVKWMFNNYAADFVVENVILECENMVTGTNEDYLLVVQNAGDKATFNNVTVNGYDAKKVYLTPGSTFTALEEFAVKTDNGYVVIYDNGTYTAQQAVAEVDGVQYATLQAAVEAAQAGKTVTLLIDATGAGVVIDKNVTIDFGGKTYTINQAVGSAGTETLGFQILKNKTVTLMNGTLTSTAAVEGSKEIKMLIQNYAHLTLSGMNLVDNTDHILYALSNNSGNVNLVDKTNITTDEVAFDVYDYSSAGYEVPTVNVNTTGIIDGKIEVSESISNNLNISGGLFTAQIAEAWCADGYIPTTEVIDETTYYTVKLGKYVAQVNDGAKYESLVEAVAAAEDNDVVKLLDDATGAGLKINKDITVDFGGFTYTINQAVGSTGTESQGFQLLPEAEDVKLMNGNIAVTQGTNVVWMINDYAKNLTVKNMTFDCENMVWSKSVYFLVGNNEHGTDPKCVFEGVAINNYHSQDRAMVLLENNTELKAQAGLDVVTDPGFAVVYENGVYKVAPAVASITANEVTRYYATLQAAVNAAQANETVTLLSDAAGAGVVIDKNVTIDFGGNIYTVNQAVGSAGTETLGFQILKNNTVTLMNGTLTSTAAVEGSKEIKMLIQNYANLTLTDMNLDDATEHIQYVLSNNSGTSKINGATSITTDAVAFDVYDYTAGGYTVPTVNVETEGIIKGRIEVSATATLNISGGLFTAQIAEAWCADGYIPTTEVVDGTTYYTVKVGEYVAQIGDKKYEKFADAIAAVNNAETITLLTDNAESVTIKQVAGKSFTIDGAGKTYKGTITVDGNKRSTGAETLTIKNVNFLAEGQWQSSIFAVKSTFVHNVTIDGCTFTGNDAKQAYGIRLHHSYNIVVKNTTGNKLYDLVYANTAVTGFTAENVTVTESGMGFMMPYGKNLSFKNVTLNVEGAGVGIYNYNASTATFENCNFTAYPPVHLEQKNTTNAYSLTFNGTNTFAGSDKWLKVNGTDAKFTVTLNDPSLDVHKTSGLIAGVGNVYYNTFDYALAQAKSTQEEDAVNILETVILSADKAINFESIAVTSTVNPAFRITDGANVTVENGNMNTEDGGYNFILGASDGSSAGNLTIKSGKYHASTTVASVTKGNLVIEGGEFSATPYNGDCRFLINCIDANYNADPRTANVEIKGGTFVGFDPENNLAEGASTNFCAEGYLSDDNGDGTYTVREGVYVAQVNDGAKYESLVEAVAAAEDNDVVKLLDNATGAGLVINKDITVDFGGFTYTINQAVGSTGTETQGFQLLPSAENVILKNGIINVDGANVIWMINDYAKNLTVEAMTFNCSGMNLEHSAVMGLVINNLNNTDPKVVFGENVVFNGLTTSILLEHDTQLTAGEGWMNAIEPEDGYVVVYKEGVYTVARPVASITREGITTEYATLGDATAAAVNGDVVNLLCDVNGSEVTVDLQVAKKITVDLGGHKYTSTGTAFIAYRAGTELTLTNGTVHGNGAAGATLRTTYKATLTLGDNLTVTAGPQALAILVQDGKFFVNPNTDNVIVNGGIDCIKVQENALEVSIASGTYTEDVQEWCADGYVSQNNGDGTWTVREADYVAEIEGGAKYESLKAAIDAAQDGQTVIVLKDITLGYEDANDYFDTEKQYKSFFNISGKAVTVNLNEKTVKAVLEGEETVMAFFSTENGGDLTIKGGNLEIDTEKAVYSLLVCYTGGKLTVENGNYKLNLAADDLVYTQEDNNVVINGGTFYLGNVGTGQNGQPWIINAKGQNSANVDVNGGTFNADINHQFWANEVYVPETLALKDNGDGTWTIEKSVAYVVERAISTGAYDRNVGYATLAEAVNPLGNSVDNTVTVIKSHELAETVIVNKNVEFIFENGVQVTAPEYSYENGVHTNPTAFRIVDGATVTVNSFNITSGVNGLYNFILGAADGETTGNLVINDGTFVANTSVVSVTKGNLVIEGGDFSLVEGTTDYRYLINCIDANYNNGSATVAISGGTFHNWNPQDNAAETGGHANFCASGYGAVETATDSNIWMVVPMQGITLLSGWNWFSSYINIEGEEGLETLQNALAGNATIIKSQSSEFTAYSQNGQWYGGLTSLSIDKMYMIEMSNAHTLSLTGDIVDPSTVNITLKQGWNWIAYPISEEYAIEDVMVNDIIAKNDQVKSHKEGFAEYFNGSWYGDLNTLKPGQGYMYGNKDGEHQFTYTIPAPGAKSELRANVTAENNRWVPASSQFVNNMTMVAMVDGVNADSYEVAAFANGEVRGSARPIYIEPLDAYMLFLTIYGDEVEEMTFRYYDLTTGEEYALDDRINYSNDARVGSIAEPYIFRGTVGIGENAMTEINIYPNPTTTGSEVNLGSVCDTVEVFNALGVKIAEYQNVDSIDALETAGIYVIRITNDGNVQNCRLIVK